MWKGVERWSSQQPSTKNSLKLNRILAHRSTDRAESDVQEACQLVHASDSSERNESQNQQVLDQALALFVSM